MKKYNIIVGIGLSLGIIITLCPWVLLACGVLDGEVNKGLVALLVFGGLGIAILSTHIAEYLLRRSYPL